MGSKEVGTSYEMSSCGWLWSLFVTIIWGNPKVLVSHVWPVMLLGVVGRMTSNFPEKELKLTSSILTIPLCWFEGEESLLALLRRKRQMDTRSVMATAISKVRPIITKMNVKSNWTVCLLKEFPG